MEQKDLFIHFKKLQEALRNLHGQALLNMATFEVEARIRKKPYTLYPFFLKEVPAGAPVFTANGKRLGGWLPYSDELAVSFAKKLKFKELLTQNGCATPNYSTSPDTPLTGLIIKKNDSSSGNGFKGPFHSASECKLNTQEGEFYEKFIPGRLAKIWFWNHCPVTLELNDMPSVVGDGRSTIGELLANKPIRENVRSHDVSSMERINRVLALYKKDLNVVLPADQRQIVDICYSSIYAEPVQEIPILAARDLPYQYSLWLLGKVLRSALREENYANAAFTVDAVLDANDKLWFLEVDPNPAIHPAVYPVMLKDLSEGYPEMRISPRVPAREPGTLSGTMEGSSIPAGGKTTIN